ncbi:MAG TPA: hypothetical protein VFM97_09890 [Gammaproteobacteria bacterium]|nr:hypothetical protein [Gammaproteobacteria bacterium]
MNGSAANAEQRAAVRRAIISVRPDYFSWSAVERERYRATMSDDDGWRIRRSLLHDLFGIHADSETTLEQALDQFDDEQYLRLNSALLQLQGIGDDNIFLNESFAEQTSLLDFETVYDYDLNDYEFQEKVRQEESPEYVPKPYRGDLHFVWARLQIDGKFHYATLMTAARHLLAEMEELSFDKIGELIPHNHVAGPDHGKPVKGGLVWDRRIEAGGMEAQLDELQHRCWAWQAQRFDELLTAWDREALGRVFIIPKETNGDPQVDFVFSDTTALRAVRFRHFMADCRAIVGDVSILKRAVDDERRRIAEFLEQAYEDIVTNFDPRVVKLRKKRKITIARGAWDDLEG